MSSLCSGFSQLVEGFRQQLMKNREEEKKKREDERRVTADHKRIMRPHLPSISEAPSMRTGGATRPATGSSLRSLSTVATEGSRRMSLRDPLVAASSIGQLKQHRMLFLLVLLITLSSRVRKTNTRFSCRRNIMSCCISYH